MANAEFFQVACLRMLQAHQCSALFGKRWGEPRPIATGGCSWTATVSVRPFSLRLTAACKQHGFSCVTGVSAVRSNKTGDVDDDGVVLVGCPELQESFENIWSGRVADIEHSTLGQFMK